MYIHISIIKGKGKTHPITRHEGPQVEYRCSYTLSLTSELDGVGGQRHAPADLPPGMTWYPLYGCPGGPQGRSGRVRKISPQTEFDPNSVQSVASHYTNWAIPSHHLTIAVNKTPKAEDGMIRWCATVSMRETADLSFTGFQVVTSFTNQ
jgi:hypothetical protein